MMHTTTANSRGNGLSETAAAAIWIGLVTIGSVLGSLAFACAAPLAAMATIAGLKMRHGEGLALVGAAWLANQLVGFLVLDYPHTFDTFAWGGAIGIASVAAFIAAALVARLHTAPVISVLAGFLAAFAAYEATLFATALVLGGSETGFSGAAVLRIFEVNVVGLGVLLVAYRAAALMHLVRPQIAVATASA